MTEGIEGRVASTGDKTPLIATTLKRLQDLNNGFRAHNDSLQRIVSRVTGASASPEPLGKENSNKPIRSGLIGELENIADVLEENIMTFCNLHSKLSDHV